MKSTISTSTTKALWFSDLHLDKATDQEFEKLLDTIRGNQADVVLISGDISHSRYLPDHLRILASVSATKEVYYVTGNHDYFGSNLHDVDTSMHRLCSGIGNLHYLDGSQIIRLSRHVCLIGHRGWSDARAGYGQQTVIDVPDRHAIEDFDGLTLTQSLEKMTLLGMESARVIRSILPLALTRYRHVIVLTHVPPFPEAAMYNQKPCGPTHSPHYTNLSCGLAMSAIAKAFPHRRITVLAGHTHHGCMVRIRPNLTIRVAQVSRGHTDHCVTLEF